MVKLEQYMLDADASTYLRILSKKLSAIQKQMPMYVDDVQLAFWQERFIIMSADVAGQNAYRK
jgi:hypothetical protein